MNYSNRFLMDTVLVLAVIMTFFFLKNFKTVKMNLLKWAGTILVILGGPPFFFYLLLSLFNGDSRSQQGRMSGLQETLAESISRIEDKIHLPIMLIFIMSFLVGQILIWIGDKDNRKTENEKFNNIKIFKKCPACGNDIYIKNTYCGNCGFKIR